MQFAVEQNALVAAMARVGRIVERRSTIPILSNVLLSARGNGVTLRATDLDVEISVPLKAEVAVEGKTTVAASLLHDIARRLPAGAQVMIEHDPKADQVRVKAGRSKFDINALPAHDFPDLTVGAFTKSFTLSAGDLGKLIARTSFAMSTEETRYYLNGIYLHTVDGRDGPLLRAVSTDGHRLAQTEVPAPEGTKGMPGIIVPRKTVSEVKRLVDEINGDVSIDVSDTKIRLTFGGMVMTSKLIDGTFPDYARVIPQGNNIVVTVNRDGFVQAVDRVASVVDAKNSRGMKMSLEGATLKLSVSNPDAGTAEEDTEVDYDGPPLTIGFNSKYIAEILNQVDGTAASLYLAEPGSPVLIRPENDLNTLFVLMPMRV